MKPPGTQHGCGRDGGLDCYVTLATPNTGRTAWLAVTLQSGTATFKKEKKARVLLDETKPSFR